MRKRILIIDDSSDFAGSVSDTLKSQGYDTEIAQDGNEGIRKTMLNTYDLILLDINMPQMGGRGFIQKFQNNKQFTPVVVVSGMDVNDVKNYFFEHGAISYLNKPFTKEALVSLVKNTLKLTHQFSFESEKQTNNLSLELIIPDYNSLNFEGKEFVHELLKICSEFMLDNQYSVEFISTKMKYSRRQFARKTKKYFNRNPHEILSELRFKMIHNTIETNRYTLSEVSKRLGFSSTSYFKKLYTKYAK
jgi:DNA-binding NtrC family response regulator